MVVFGSGGVGKSALTVQFVSGTFVEKYDPTLEDVYRKEIDVDGSPAILEVLDTAGTEQFACMGDTYPKRIGQGYLLVYSVIKAQTFIDIQPFRDRIKCLRGVESPIVLVGNKCDLEEQRAVEARDGEILAQEWNCPFFETSAKNNYNVSKMFAEIVRLIVRRIKNLKTKDSNCCSCCTLL